MLTPRFTLPRLRRATFALPAALAATVGLALAPSAAHASNRQITIIQDQGQLQSNPAGTLAQMQALGATTVRVFAIWSQIAPSPMATRKPNFNATNPNAYPSANWAFLDELDRLAKQDGMTIDLVVTGGQPRWAMGAGAPAPWVYTKRNPGAAFYAWKPNVGEFGQFVTAVGKRYDGSFRPTGQSSALPKIHFWSLYNEPNFGQDLGPQATDTSRISYAPEMYRNLVRVGWSALHATGHGRDTILIGELAAHGYALTNGYHSKHLPQGLPGDGAQTEPLPFLRTLYCVSSSSHPLTGRAASEVGCPTNAAGRRSFRRDNPGLFDASGVGDHPYANTATPASDGKGNPEWSTLPNYGRLEVMLDGANRAWGSRARLSIYTDEYGYITNPPVRIAHYVNPETAAKYINWAEYLMWRNPRVASYDQYLIQDGTAYKGDPGFASGLEFANGAKKPSYAAFQLPLWLPNDVLRRPGTELVWGIARPAVFTGRATHRTQSVLVQFQAHGRGGWKTIDTVHSNSYFTVRPRFTVSGRVRLAYTYPRSSLDPQLDTSFAGTTVYSRVQDVTVH